MESQQQTGPILYTAWDKWLATTTVVNPTPQQCSDSEPRLSRLDRQLRFRLGHRERTQKAESNARPQEKVGVRHQQETELI